MKWSEQALRFIESGLPEEQHTLPIDVLKRASRADAQKHYSIESWSVAHLSS